MSSGTEDILGISRVSINDSHDTNSAPLPVPHRLSSFERLPLEIRQQIYRNLLVSDYVKEASPDLQAATYSFQTAILATNRTIAREARPFLDKNIFVVVVTTFKDFCDCLKREGVPIVTSGPNAALFTGPLLSIGMKFLPHQHGPLQTVLMVARDLPRLCRFIRIQTLTMSPLSEDVYTTVRLNLPKFWDLSQAYSFEPEASLRTIQKCTYGDGAC